MTSKIQTGLYSKSNKQKYISKFFIIILIFLLSFTILNLIGIFQQPYVIGSVSAEVEPEYLGSGPGRFNSIVAEDIDDDGRCEIVFGNYDGYVTILEYRDHDFFVEWQSPKIGHRVWGITVADFIGFH